MLQRISGISLYHQIKERLRQEIKDINYGEQIKTEQQLAAEYGVSRGTVRQAINDLVNEGLVYKVQGCGTFKGGVAIGRSRFHVRSFTDQLLACGIEPGIRDVQLQVQAPEERIAKHLQIPSEEEVFLLSRVRLGNGEPISLSTAYIRRDRVPFLKASDLDMSLISLFTDKLQIPLVRQQSYCTACPADGRLAEKLGLAPGSPVFRMEHLAFCDEHTPLFFDITESVGEKYVMQIEQFSN